MEYRRSFCNKCRIVISLVGVLFLLQIAYWTWNSFHLSVTKSEFLDLRIIVIVFNRAQSMRRLLESLNRADYYGDNVTVDVWIDRSKKTGEIDGATYRAAVEFQFLPGSLTVHNHSQHVGIYGQWMDTWHPVADSREIAVILEDDLTVSRHFYKWLKAVHKKYGTESGEKVTKINGFSMQGISMKHGGAAGDLHAPEPNIVFLYPVVGSWGFSPNRVNWMNFIAWYKHASKIPSFQPLVPNLVPTAWFKACIKEGRADSMWTMWHIYYAYTLRGEVTLYPNLPRSQGLSINWREPGLHYKHAKPNQTWPLLVEWKEEYVNLPDVPVCLDANGKVVATKLV
jgi:hypothetical protein